jgi:hypothetical protein
LPGVISAAQVLADEGSAGMTGSGLIVIPFWLIVALVIALVVYRRKRRR